MTTLLTITLFLLSQLHGVITDPSGALIPGATVQLRGPDGERSQLTDSSGQYSFSDLAPGKYDIQVTAPDFKPEKQSLDLQRPTLLNFQLMLKTQSQVITVNESASSVSIDPDSNASALVLKKSELDGLSDDPDELARQLQALAGPGTSSEGGQIFTDGLTGTVPSKSSIREVRINSNPFSPEFDSPGISRIEILTKPGGDALHGQLSFQYNNEKLNTRSPLYLQSPSLPPYKNMLWNGAVSGPIKKDKASFTVDIDHRNITENAFILATNLDSNLNPKTVNQAVLTPQQYTRWASRLDFAINARHTLIARYEDTRRETDNLGIGGFRLREAGYNQTARFRTLQTTETALLTPMLVNETRFQFSHSAAAMTGAASSPSIAVQDAFTSGGAAVGDSSYITNRFELSNLSILNHNKHTLKWGGRFRGFLNNDRSVNNFNGTFTFFGRNAPELDGNSQPIPGTSVQSTGLEVYERTLRLQQLGFSATQIRTAGGGASLFSLSTGTPLTRVALFDLGLFLNDDWKARPNVTLSYGIRYEHRSNISDYRDWGPRIGLAWALDGKGATPAKTVLRVGGGVFYNNRPYEADQMTLLATRYNGVTQRSYLLTNPDFFPNLPSLSSIEGGSNPQTIQLISPTMQAGQQYFASVTVERQIVKSLRLTFEYLSERQVHQIRQRSVNAKFAGTNLFPYGDRTVRMQTESSGLVRWNAFRIRPIFNWKKLSVSGVYSFAFLKNDFEIPAADPYNLHAEWGPGWGDSRHYMNFGPSVPLPLKMTANFQFVYWSGPAFNITTGLPDPSGDGLAVQRPTLLDLEPNTCNGPTMKYTTQFGCFDLQPVPGTPTIQRNYARGPGSANLSIRLSKTWAFVKKETQGTATQNKYSLTLGVFAINPLNHPNFGTPNGNLSSPFFGQPLNMQNAFSPSNATYNRKLTLQVQWAF